jgi:hypothetical protein
LLIPLVLVDDVGYLGVAVNSTASKSGCAYCWKMT